MLLSPLCFHSRSVRRSKNIPPNSSRLRRGYQAVFHGAPQQTGWCLELPLPISGHRKILDTSCAGDEITLVIAIAVAFSIGRVFSPFRSYTLIKLFTHHFFNQHTYCTHSKGTQMLTKFRLFRHFFLC